LYQTRQFAELAGVTVRTLHHYDRVGLLKPRRTGAGYRVYQSRDLERLEQIVALKFLGLPLKQIRSLLERQALTLPAALRMQRRVLEEKRRLLDRAILAIQEAETSLTRGKAPEEAVLKKIIEVIAMQSNNDWLEKYQSAAAREKVAARGKEWTPELQARVSQQWTELLAEAEAAMGEDPAGAKVQALADRWIKLVEGFTQGDPDLTQSVKNAWSDYANWPADARQNAGQFYKPQVWSFMQKAIALKKK
jgi:MerR family transcriptional regulator, thiopeptide resistance regulator